MVDFKPSLGYLALTNKFDILPMYLDGHARRDAQGRAPAEARASIAAHIGPLLTLRGSCEAATAELPRSEQYREASRLVERRCAGSRRTGSVDRGRGRAPSRGRLTADERRWPDGDADGERRRATRRRSA